MGVRSSLVEKNKQSNKSDYSYCEGGEQGRSSIKPTRRAHLLYGKVIWEGEGSSLRLSCGVCGDVLERGKSGTKQLYGRRGVDERIRMGGRNGGGRNVILASSPNFLRVRRELGNLVPDLKFLLLLYLTLH